MREQTETLTLTEVDDDKPPGPFSVSAATAVQPAGLALEPAGLYPAGRQYASGQHAEPVRAAQAKRRSGSRPGRQPDSSVAVHSWHNWRWQMRHRIRSLTELAAAFPGLELPAETAAAAAVFPLAITPYYASLIASPDPSDPVFRMAVPDAAELYDPPFLDSDPLAEDHDMPVPRLIHRYPDRALVIVTATCAAYCRHCTRKRLAGQSDECMTAPELAAVVNYLQAHPGIHDVIVSGGDPFTMSTAALERVLQALRTVNSVEVIRIGTRTPVTLPMRVTAELTDMLRRYHPLWINTHFNHPVEVTPAAVQACGRLVDAGIPLGNQSVLLRGVNDDPVTMERLCRGLIRIRVRPYYLFQCDLVRGVEHFRTPLSRGIEIMEYLRGRLSGLAIPTFVVDAPGGGGKIPILPNYVVSTSPTHSVLRNSRGALISYPEPCHVENHCTRTETMASGLTVWDLAAGRAAGIGPAPGDKPLGHTRSRDTRSAARDGS